MFFPRAPSQVLRLDFSLPRHDALLPLSSGPPAAAAQNDFFIPMLSAFAVTTSAYTFTRFEKEPLKARKGNLFLCEDLAAPLARVVFLCAWPPFEAGADAAFAR